MEPKDLEENVRKRLAMSGRVVAASAIVSVVLFTLVMGAFYSVTYDSVMADAANQMRLFVYSNTNDFESGDVKSLGKAAANLLRDKIVSHVVVYGPQGHVLTWNISSRYGAANADIAELDKIKTTAKLVMATSGADLVRMKLPSGNVVLRAYTPVRKGPTRLGDFEMGFFKSELVGRSLQNLRIPGAVSVACAFLLPLIVSIAIRQWEKSRTRTLTGFIETEIGEKEREFGRKMDSQRREHESKDLDGGHFFNIMESVRDIASSPDRAMFVRRSVLSSVRLFRCRLVSFYLLESSNRKAPAWRLIGRYDGKGYVHELQEALDPSVNARLNAVVTAGSTELIEGYPAAGLQALVIGISAPKPVGLIVLSNKVGIFDSKDLVAARAFAGFLPNLFSWHLSK